MFISNSTTWMLTSTTNKFILKYIIHNFEVADQRKWIKNIENKYDVWMLSYNHFLYILKE